MNQAQQEKNHAERDKSSSGNATEKMARSKDSYKDKDSVPMRSMRSMKKFKDFATERAAKSDKSFGRISGGDTDNH